MKNIARRSAAGGLQSSTVLKPAALAVLIGVSGAALVHPAPLLAANYAFSSVQIEGLNAVDPGTVTSLLGIGRGETVSDGELNAAYQRLSGSGLFDKIELIPAGGTLIVRLTEFPIVNRINIEGNRVLKDPDLLAMIESKPRYVFNPATAEADADTIAAAYGASGRIAATVTPRIIRRANNSVDLVFEVVEGKNVEIERITFTGNRAFSDARLRRVVTSKQAGLLRFLVKVDTYDPGRVEFDKQVLKDFYASRGYPDFDAVAVTSELTNQEDGYYVTYEIREGQQFSFGEISAVSEVEGIDAAAYEGYAQVRSGATYNPDVLDRAVARMENALQKAGYGFVRVDPRVTRDERSGTLDIEFAIVRGARITVERIDIEGNETTLDRVIRTQFTVVEGDPFNPRAIRAAAERIRALGYFSNVDVRAREGSATDTVVVDVNVEEQGTGSFSAGASYALGEGVGFIGSFTETNFLGRGQYLKVELSAGLDLRTYAFSFAEPNLFGRDLSVGVNASYSERFWADDLFKSSDGYIKPFIQFPISELASFNLNAGVELSNIQNYTGDSAIMLAEAARERQIGATAGLGFTFDTRRNGLEEPTFAYLKVSGEVGGLGADNEYVRGKVVGNVTSTALNDDITLRATVEGGAIASIGSGPGTRITDRFRMSPQQVLGFATLGMGPRDLTATDEDALGGNFYTVAQLEADFPIGLPEEYGITGGLFMHTGSVWGLDNPGTVDDSFSLRASAGAALNWDSPLGPLRFYYAVPFVKESYDEERRFGVSISTGF
ncbi:MAG: outer membrane protein assembly factor BamA [Maritimibacter sp.]|nr:outer membrane protein assembly factor BamA [Maritimibacter sp.]